MLACSSDEQLRSEVQSCMGAAMYPVAAFNGIDQRGAPYASFLLDPVGAALAGLSWKDGVDTGGWPWDLQSTMPNVEDNEWFYPILYLWRKELVNSGGAGKYRGGNSGELAFIPHGTDHISLFTASGHCAVPGPGLHGGLSPATTRFSMKRGAEVVQQIQETRRMPTSVEELHGKTEYIAPKAFDVSQTPADVFLLSWAGAGGYGDPLERDAARVLLDIQRGNITPDWASEAYGVVLDGQGRIDAQATDKQRAKLRKARLRKAPKRERRQVDISQARRIAEGLHLADGLIACGRCEKEISHVSENYKLHCAVTERPVKATNPYVLDPKTYVDDKMVFRGYACPSCGLLLQIEIARPTDPPLWDVQLA
jgi:N-methylhydantoinase B